MSARRRFYLSLMFIVGAFSEFAVSAPAISERNTLRVMTFNLTCDFCGKNKVNGSFEARLRAVADTIDRHDPDLVSLQELRTENQVERLRAMLREQYTPIFARAFFLNYPDPTLLVRSTRFEVLEKNGFWLTPRTPDFGFGWKFGVPRRVEYVELLDRFFQDRFVFVGSHFDNNPRNREPSARLLAKRFSSSLLPVIFAGDTNLRPDREGYGVLASEFRDTFREVRAPVYVANRASPAAEDACNLEKAPTFPACRVDHVLVSLKSPWKTKKWSVDVFRYETISGFISDHRAIVVDLVREGAK